MSTNRNTGRYEEGYHGGYEEGYRDGSRAQRERTLSDMSCRGKLVVPRTLPAAAEEALRGFPFLAEVPRNELRKMYHHLGTLVGREITEG